MSTLLSQLGVQSYALNPGYVLPNQDAHKIVLSPQSEVSTSLEVEPVQARALYLGQVCIGEGLEEIWQNDESDAWALWQSICQVFEWEADESWFVDALHLFSDDVVAETLQELQAAQVSRVFIFGCDHDIVDSLYEVCDVVLLPSLDEMLEDPFAKKQFYQTLKVELAQ